MKHKISFLILATVLLSGCSLPFIGKKTAGLKITAQPNALVFVNGEHLGNTPFLNETLKPGEYTLKLEVEGDASKMWETRVNLNSKLLTSVDVTFGSGNDTVSYVILNLEPLASKNTSQIAVVSLPDSAIVKLDGQPEGFSPLNLEKISEGDHEIVLGSPGYKQLTIPVKTSNGYKVTVSAKLTKDIGLALIPTSLEATDSGQVKGEEVAVEAVEKETSPATPSAVLPEKPYVTILETGTGWLRVRSEPNASQDNELAKVNVGDSFPFVEKNETGWYQIEYETNKLGWISARYADLTE